MITNLKQVKSVDIIVISGSLEVQAIRALLEAFNIQVRVHYIGNVKHLIALFQNPRYLHSTTIICCHGDDEGFLLPELSGEIENTMPFHNKLTHSNLGSIIKLEGQLILNTGCCLGKQSFAKVFLDNGASNYIGAEDYIESDSLITFITTFMYFYLTKHKTILEAFDLSLLDDETEIMRIW